MSAPHFVLIDDDHVHNLFSKIAILSGYVHAEIEVFTNPEDALEYIANEMPEPKDNLPAILLLDLDMPSMDGWEFLRRFAKLSTQVKENIRIFILSSSINQEDKARAYSNKYVNGFLEKPLMVERLIKSITYNTIS